MYTYQLFLYLFYVLPKPIGDVMTSAEAVILGRFPSKGATPVIQEMNWPYRSFINHRSTIDKKLDAYEPKGIPMLFLFGAGLPKIIRFTDKKWQKIVKDSYPGVSRCEAMATGHWFVNQNQYAVMAVLEKWLAESEPILRAKL
jgi:hypothetical protein